MCHKLPWLTNSLPEIPGHLNMFSQTTDDMFTAENIKTLNTHERNWQLTRKMDTYELIQYEITWIIKHSDASIDSDPSGPSKHGNLIFIGKEYNSTNFLDYTSSRIRGVIQSVLGYESFGLAEHVIPQFSSNKKSNNLFTSKYPLLTHSVTLFNILIRNGNTVEKT